MTSVSDCVPLKSVSFHICIHAHKIERRSRSFCVWHCVRVRVYTWENAVLTPFNASCCAPSPDTTLSKFAFLSSVFASALVRSSLETVQAGCQARQVNGARISAARVTTC
jgi:hypothetical protein